MRNLRNGLMMLVGLQLLLGYAAFGQTYTIQTIAGGALPTGVPLTSVSFGEVRGIAEDPAGNLLVVSEAYQGVLRLELKSGTASLVAGNGVSGSGGDGGPALNAQFSDPHGIAVDRAGNLYIADSGNNRIRRISNGIITTVAGTGVRGYSGDGGPAASAQLDRPTGIAVDSSGALYIADANNNRVRKVSGSVITTLAGGGSSTGDGGPATAAALSGPVGITVDPVGNVYFTDEKRIRKVSPGGTLTTVAGATTCTFATCFGGDGGPALNALLTSPTDVAIDASGNLYIADSGNSRIRKVSAGIIKTVAGNGGRSFAGDGGPATSATLGEPEGLTIGATGALFIADTNNHRVRQIIGDVISTLAGNGTDGFNGDGLPPLQAQLGTLSGIAIDPVGDVYFSDPSNNLVRKIAKGTITTVAGNGGRGFSGDNQQATSSSLRSPAGLAVDADGSLYIADSSNFRIRKVSSGLITTTAGSGKGAETGSGDFGGDGGPAIEAQLYYPVDVAIDNNTGTLYIADSANERIRKVANGLISTAAGNGSQGDAGDNGPAAEAQLYFPFGTAVDQSGNLFIADGARVRRVANGVITTVAGNGKDGFSGDGGPATEAQLAGARTVAVDANNNLFIIESNRVRRVSNGIISTIAGNGTSGFGGDNGPATAALLNSPRGIAVDSSGTVYVSEDRRVRTLTPTETACRAAVNRDQYVSDLSGGTLEVTIQAPPSCKWAVQSIPDWIRFSGTALGSGPATVSFAIAANAGLPRLATVSVAGLPIVISQAGAPPAITPNGIISASGSTVARPASPGALISIYGSRLASAPKAASFDSANRLPLVLGGTSVLIGTYPVPLLYAGVGQINAVVPFEAVPGSYPVTVTTPSGVSAPQTLTVTASSPAVFTNAVLNAATGRVVSSTNPLRAGDVAIIYCTGLGAVTPTTVSGQAAPGPPFAFTSVSPTVTIAGQPVQVANALLSPGFVGLYQIGIIIPQGIPAGTGALVVSISGFSSPAVSVYTTAPITTDQLTVSPADGASISATQGSAASFSKTYTLKNAGTGTLLWTAKADVVWLTLSPSSGSLSPNQSVTVTLATNSSANSLSPQDYTGTVTFASGGTSLTRSVSLSISVPTPPVSGSGSCELVSSGPYQFQVWNTLPVNALVQFGDVVLPSGQHGYVGFGADMRPNECDIIGLPQIATYVVDVSRSVNGTVVHNTLTFTNTTSGFVFNGRSAYTVRVTTGTCSAAIDQTITYNGKSVYSVCVP